MIEEEIIDSISLALLSDRERSISNTIVALTNSNVIFQLYVLIFVKCQVTHTCCIALTNSNVN